MDDLKERLRNIETLLDAVTFSLNYGPAQRLGLEAAGKIHELEVRVAELEASIETADWEANHGERMC